MECMLFNKYEMADDSDICFNEGDGTWSSLFGFCCQL